MQSLVDHPVFLYPTNLGKTSSQLKRDDMTIYILIFIVIVFIDEKTGAYICSDERGLWTLQFEGSAMRPVQNYVLR